MRITLRLLSVPRVSTFSSQTKVLRFIIRLPASGCCSLLSGVCSAGKLTTGIVRQFVTRSTVFVSQYSHAHHRVRLNANAHARASADRIATLSPQNEALCNIMYAASDRKGCFVYFGWEMMTLWFSILAKHSTALCRARDAVLLEREDVCDSPGIIPFEAVCGSLVFALADFQHEFERSLWKGGSHSHGRNISRVSRKTSCSVELEVGPYTYFKALCTERGASQSIWGDLC